MEVECWSERFTAAGILYPRKLETLGREGHKTGINQAVALALERKGSEHKEAIEVLHSKPPGVPVETRWCIGAVH